MKRMDMLRQFCHLGILNDMYWLGAIEKADNVNGLTYNGHAWIVYYRHHGQLTNVAEFPTQEAACDELYSRVLNLYKNKV